MNVKVTAGDADLPKYLDRLVSPLYGLFISLAMRDDSVTRRRTDSRVVKAVASVITLIVGTVPLEYVLVLFCKIFTDHSTVK